MSLIPAGCAPEAPKHVKFTSSNWIGDWLVVYVPKILVEDELGYTSEIVNVSVPAMWAALGANEINVTTIPWLPNQENFKKEYADRVEYLGVMYPDAPQGVFVPKWMYDQGIRAVSDLNDPELAKQFDIDGDGKGDWLGCDPGWACAQQNDEFIEMHAWCEKKGADYFPAGDIYMKVYPKDKSSCEGNYSLSYWVSWYEWDD